jgi:hypothetical protein
MAATEPGERPPAGDSSEPGAGGETRPAAREGTRQLDRAPGERYAGSGAAATGAQVGPARRQGVLLRAAGKAGVAGLVGMLVLYLLGAILSSSAGLVFVAGLTGAAVGLLVARAAAPGRAEEPALTRRGAAWLAVAISVLAVVLAAVGTWLHALAEGGALGVFDYLFETFGFVVPLELAIASLAAAWGAGAGPVEA